ncbi:TIR domain-containing protein [Roseobacter litoralis]|uniref:TIR domain-containing protein n=1 Tax=Roseobacter litoralis TaxID=42443 RepID=UPI0024941F91|nr:TIR domain-containing protein [Roseobacter litoralis]
MSSDNTKYLRLVEDVASPTRVEEAKVEPRFSSQISLFSDASRATLGFIAASKMSDTTFQSLLSDVRPKFIFDLRRIPGFSIGALSRKTVFALFNAYDIQYYDAAGALDIKSARDASSNPKILVPKIMQILLRRKRPLVGPILFFVDDEYLHDDFLDGISATLPHEDDRGWEIVVWDEKPPTLNDLEKRKTIFISHANPQDNDVARWLGSRLAAEGYEVWSDITKLIGGEQFWDTIENTIREKSACVVVLLSKDGHEKPGVLDEVNVAVSTERRLGIENFVIPMRIDDLPFGEIRANIARKNIIDASSNLFEAFKVLGKTLEEMNVPRDSNEVSETLRRWRTLAQEQETERFDEEPKLVENAVRITSWPDQIRKLLGTNPVPQFKPDIVRPFLATAPVMGGQLCFGGREELLNAVAGLNTQTFGASSIFKGKFDAESLELLGLKWHEARRALTQIVRKSFDEFCHSSGLAPYQLASGKSCWFEPLSKDPGNEVQFIDIDGKRKRRSIVGRSDKRGVYWHFAVEGHFDHNTQCLRLKSHVVFTEDGLKPIESSAKQHSLRRGFCRSWWNDRWRTLLQAMLFKLSQGEENFELPVSPFQVLEVEARLVEAGVPESRGALIHFPEPKLEVGFKQQTEDPREGLMLFGPRDFERNPKVLRIGVVGAPEGIELFDRWCKKFRGRVDSGAENISNRLVPFPGFDAAFGAEWPESPLVTKAIPRADLLNSIRIQERHQAVAKTVGLYVDAIQSLRTNDDIDVDIWFVVVPEEVFVLGRPNSRVPSDIAVASESILTKKMASRFSDAAPSLFAEDNEIARVFDFHADFRHQLKNRLLEDKEVTQVFRESSIVHSLADPNESNNEKPGDDPELFEEELSDGSGRRMQGALDVHWNIATTSFFKAGGRPWKVSTARPGVCYVGLIFKQDRRKGGNNHCCGAQLFLESGEGVVFKGALGPWYSKESHQFHLSKTEAKRLIGVAIEAYRDEHGIDPSEMFVHGRTRFNHEELEGFQEAAGDKTEITGVRITRTNEVKIFTSGDLPVNRGTALLVDDRLGYLWTSGYIDHLQTYQGRETPNPLRVEICGRSSSTIETVLADIMTLTKMNFNSSIFADGFPVSMRFAEAIGDVLMATEGRKIPPLPFRHYI